MPRRLTTLALLTLLAAALLAAHPAPSQAPAAEAIRPEAIRAHMRFLADDLLEGRATSTRGYDLAALYVAAQMESYGLEPAGDNGTYLQSVRLRRAALVPEESAMSILTSAGERALKFGEEFLPTANPADTAAGVEAGVVFAGYGVYAPQYRLDDYAGADVRGKIVAVIAGAPASLPPTARAHFSSPATKAAVAAARGAVGILTLRSAEDDQRQPLERMAALAGRATLRWLDPAGRPNNTWPGFDLAATLSSAAGELLFSGAPVSLAQAVAAARKGPSPPVTLAARVRARVASRHEDSSSHNVAGMLRGSDPRLAAEFVVYSAHLDHVGIGREVDGDAIYNGAVDNASGVAAMLEAARAFAALPQRPRRSLVFVAVTAEEVGLLGSAFYAAFPAGPVDGPQAMVANINFDCITAFYPLHDVVVLGGEHSTLGDVAARVAARMGLALSPDPMPEQNFFTRSDHYSFVRQGVPAIISFTGVRSGDPQRTGDAIFREWLRTLYHRPGDDMRQPYDFAAAARFTEFHFRVGLEVAQDDARVAWKPGDFFGETFGQRGMPAAGSRDEARNQD